MDEWQFLALQMHPVLADLSVSATARVALT
jgi:hypothetical protein